MNILIIAFLAGILTILAPCVITLLPVILGGSLGEKDYKRPLIVALSLGTSVFIFTLLLKASTALLMIHPQFWQILSGVLITAFGLTLIFPSVWDRIVIKLKLYKSDEVMHKNTKKQGVKGSILLGASLGPVFATCSPTYAIILAVVLPQSLAEGILSILSYCLGLVLLLIIIGYGGQKISSKFKGASNPKGLLKRSLGVLLIVTGLLIFTGYDKKLEAYIIQEGYLGPINIEQSLLENYNN